MEFLGTYIQRNNSKLKLVLFFYFPVTSCKKGGGSNFGTHIYKDLVQTENRFFFVTSLLLVVEKGVHGVSWQIHKKD